MMAVFVTMSSPYLSMAVDTRMRRVASEQRLAKLPGMNKARTCVKPLISLIVTRLASYRLESSIDLFGNLDLIWTSTRSIRWCKLDVDGDGWLRTVSYDLFKKLSNKVETATEGKEAHPAPCPWRSVWDIFQDIDRDGNGVLDKKEFEELDKISLSYVSRGRWFDGVSWPRKSHGKSSENTWNLLTLSMTFVAIEGIVAMPEVLIV